MFRTPLEMLFGHVRALRRRRRVVSGGSALWAAAVRCGRRRALRAGGVRAWAGGRGRAGKIESKK